LEQENDKKLMGEIERAHVRGRYETPRQQAAEKRFKIRLLDFMILNPQIVCLFYKE